MQHIDEAGIDGLQPQPRRYDVPLGDELVMAVLPNGSKTWTWVHTGPGRPRRQTLGVYPEMTLDGARLALAAAVEAHQRQGNSSAPAYVIRDGRIQAASSGWHWPALLIAVVALVAVAGIAMLWRAGQPMAPAPALARTESMQLDKTLATPARREQPADATAVAATVTEAPGLAPDSAVEPALPGTQAADRSPPPAAGTGATPARGSQAPNRAAGEEMTGPAQAPPAPRVGAVNATPAAGTRADGGGPQGAGVPGVATTPVDSDSRAAAGPSIETSAVASRGAAVIDPATDIPPVTGPAAANDVATPGTATRSTAVKDRDDPQAARTGSERSAPVIGLPAGLAEPAPARDVQLSAGSRRRTQNSVPEGFIEPDAIIGTRVGERGDVGAVSGDPRVARAAITSDVINREPIDALGPVVTGDGEDMQRFFFFTELRKLAGERVRHRWIAGDRVVAEVPFVIGEAWRWRIYSSKRLQRSLAGPWRVQVVLDDGTVIYSYPFEFAP